ncbi:hypothetical protein F4827_006355 [Paraburkholderia bannensis]|uniref:Uncharacterized protein n=1 Tax=Paraburkholderia bannensis TaxID=765414 RepID=A0A7W9U5S2_9BURK|nr:hypothetical protein [Paraburkholderia sp. WP4_3_2]MBB6106480.1 hypothetical protein [Paraburkholderia bannensis]
MGMALFVLAITVFFGGFGLIMNHNGRKADRERRGY